MEDILKGRSSWLFSRIWTLDLPIKILFSSVRSVPFKLIPANLCLSEGGVGWGGGGEKGQHV